MSTEEKGVNLPSKELIQKWTSLNTNIISESAACAVPNTVFIQYDNEQFFKRTLFEKEVPFITASSNVSRIKVFNDLIKRADDFINRIYSRRSISFALSPFVQAKKDTVINEAQPYFQEITSLCSDTINFLESCSSILHNLFDTATIWQSGHYSDVLLDQVCTLFYKITSLDEMKLFSSLANDLTFLKGLVKGAQSNDSSVQDLQMKINTAQYFDALLLKSENDRSKADKQKISSVFITFISQNLEKDNFLIPETVYVYIRFLMFLCKYTEQDQKVLQLLAQQASKHPLLPLAFEVSIKITDYCKSIKGFDKESQKYPFDPKTITTTMNVLRKTLETRISELPSKIANATQKVIQPDQFLEFLINLIHLIASLKNAVREQYAYKLTIQPPGTPEELKSQFMYERSIRKGYTSEELSILIRSLMLWRSICDKLRDSGEIIMKIISEAISTSFQFFVKNTCEKVIRKAKREYEQKLQDIIMLLANFCGDWNGEQIYSNIKKKKQPPYPVIPRKASPSLESIEFVRIQLQHIFNPTSEYMKNNGKKTFKNESVIEDVNGYITSSFQHTTILQFNQLISKIADQSDLYFKEVQLNLNKTINFPIKSSLPYVLCEYALQNFKIPEVTELIFFPLGIYDDAAHVASTRLNSLFLLDEVRAESQMCLEALTSMISDFVFLNYRTFASVKLLPENIKASLQLSSDNEKGSSEKSQQPQQPTPTSSPEKSKRTNSIIRSNKTSQMEQIQAAQAAISKKRDWAESRAYRLASLLQQNRFYLLMKLIDVKSMIARPIEDLITQNLNNLMKTSSSNIGTGSLIAIFHGIQIMRETHRLICEQGVELSHFNILLNVAFQNTVPNSYLSLFVSNVVGNLSDKVAKHCYLMTNPLRLVYPSKAKGLPSYTFGKQTLGKALKNAFESTISPITVDHFCCFSNLLENGELAVFIQAFSEEFRNKMMSFISTYEELDALNIGRVQDLPLTASSQQVLDHFVGAYGPYEDDQTVKKCFAEMKALGNMLAAAYMLDIAIMNSKLSREEVIGYFKGVGKDGKSYNDINRLFPKILSDELKGDDGYLFSYGLDIYPVTLTHCLASIINAIKAFEKVDLFDESSSTILDFTSLTGIASKWSVLEFIFIYAEADRVEKNESQFQTYGEGVMLIAAALILFMRQERIYHMVNIGRKIQRVKEVDFGTSKYDIFDKYSAINNYETATMDWAFQLYQPIVKHITSADIFQ